MKILWIVNTVMPDLADFLGTQAASSGTWMIDISKMLSEQSDCELAIACVYGSLYRKEKVNGITYYILPGNGKNMLFYTKRYESMWKKIRDDFKPDLVHLHGTEYSHGLSYLRVCSETPAVVSIQGILNRIKDVDFGELPIKHFLLGRTLQQNLHFNGEIEMHWLHRKNAKYEAEILNRVQYINAVNTWDSALCTAINPKLKVFQLEYNLREELYASPKWNVEAAEQHTIFTNPGGTPLKGVHKLIEAIALLKPKYPDICLRVPGMGSNGKLTVNSAYTKYIEKLIKKYGLEENIVFLGRQSGQEMCDNMLRSRVTVIPSAIEGTSLILREAMFLGCPVIAAFRGGMADFISDKIDGYLYDYQEAPYLANRIATLFENGELCLKFSKAAIEKAKKAHDRQKNAKKYLQMYKEIMCKEKDRI